MLLAAVVTVAGAPVFDLDVADLPRPRVLATRGPGALLNPKFPLISL